MINKKRKNYTQISNYLLHFWYELEISPIEKTILEKWFSGQSFYVWHDDDLGRSFDNRTVQKWRAHMIKLKYCDDPELIKIYNPETGKYYTKGYKYNFSKLQKILDEKDGNCEIIEDEKNENKSLPTSDASYVYSNASQVHSNASQVHSNASQMNQMYTHTNTILNTIRNTTTNTESVEERTEGASGTDGELRDSIIELWKKHNLACIRKCDIEKIDKYNSTQLTDFYTSIPFIKFYADDWWNTTDKSLTVALYRIESLKQFAETFTYSQSGWCKFLHENHISNDEWDAFSEKYENISQAKNELIKNYSKGELL